MTYESLQRVWHDHWSFLLDDPKASYAAPVWIGEFGTCTNVPGCVDRQKPGNQATWFHLLLRYLADHPDVGWSFRAQRHELQEPLGKQRSRQPPVDERGESCPADRSGRDTGIAAKVRGATCRRLGSKHQIGATQCTRRVLDHPSGPRQRGEVNAAQIGCAGSVTCSVKSGLVRPRLHVAPSGPPSTR
jgi:hypothetical protein